MASPQRPDPNEPRRTYEDLERARMERRSTTGAGFAWWWAFWIIIIGLAVWWAGWGWGGTGGWWWGNRARTAPTYGATTAAPGTAGGGYGANQAAVSGPGVSALTATDKHAYIGKTFQVNNVPVQSEVNNHVLWIGANNTTPMLLVLTGAGNTAANAHIGQGNRIDVTGTVQKAPPQAQAQREWSLSSGNAAKLERQGAYIQATQVHTVRP